MSDRAGLRNLLEDGGRFCTPGGALAGEEGGRNVDDWSRDGKYLMYFNDEPPHLYVLNGDRKPVLFINTPFATSKVILPQ